MTINSTIEALSEAKLDLAAGGMRELIDTELDAVCGGLFDFGNIVIAPNIATQVGVAVGGISGIN